MADPKPALRRDLRARRATRPHDDAEPGSLLAVARAAGLLGTHGGPAPVLAAYIASPGEPDPSSVRDAVRAAGGTVLLPVPLPDRDLAWAVDDGRYAPDARLPVAIPTSPVVGRGATCLLDWGVTVLMVPALAVDRCGTRLGQGGGFYDRLLADLRGAALRVVAVVHPEEVLDAGALPRAEHDVEVPVALTRDGLVPLG